ncbi:MAG: type II toxin-antitoxin system RelB/DinJ family antitoxin [Candidatus Bathyarchaeota archaeon]|nr:type II toxin-antitoxin system RelB/DinJ family antitoxin [Candidatus Termiticorpusculum sp.]
MASQKNVCVTVRVDKDLKENADALFERLGLNMSSAFNIFLQKAVSEETIPLLISTKKRTDFGHGISVDHITNAFNTAVQDDIKTNQQKGLPIAKYDTDKKQAYLEFTDGTKEYING